MGGGSLQQISNTGDNSIDHSPDGVDREPPGAGVSVLLLDDHDLLLDAVGGEHHVVLEAVAGEVVGHGAAAVDDDVAAVELLVQPAALLDGLEGEEAAEDGGKQDDEDAGGGVCAGVGGGPHLRVQSCGNVIVESDHHGGHHRGRAVHVHAVHVCHACHGRCGFHLVAVSWEDGHCDWCEMILACAVILVLVLGMMLNYRVGPTGRYYY